MSENKLKESYNILGGVFDIIALKTLPDGKVLNQTANTLINKICQLEAAQSASLGQIEELKATKADLLEAAKIGLSAARVLYMKALAECKAINCPNCDWREKKVKQLQQAISSASGGGDKAKGEDA